MSRHDISPAAARAGRANGWESGPAGPGGTGLSHDPRESTHSGSAPWTLDGFPVVPGSELEMAIPGGWVPVMVDEIGEEACRLFLEIRLPDCEGEGPVERPYGIPLYLATVEVSPILPIFRWSGTRCEPRAAR